MLQLGLHEQLDQLLRERGHEQQPGGQDLQRQLRDAQGEGAQLPAGQHNMATRPSRAEVGSTVPTALMQAATGPASAALGVHWALPVYSACESPPNCKTPSARPQVTKFDTLAGIAVKYNVPVRVQLEAGGSASTSQGRTPEGHGVRAMRPQVSEVKRFNGLLNDSAMYARDTLLIPTKLMPVG